MEYYRHVYKDSKLWKGEESPKDKHVLVYMEQGLGDVIQFLRYIPFLKERGCETTLHCPSELHSLIEEQTWGVSLLSKETPDLPEHDFHVLSMDLPFLLDERMPQGVYLKAGTKEIPEGYTNIGICWESGTSNLKRNCPLKYFKLLGEVPEVRFYSLQYQIRNQELIEGCEDMELYGVEIKDFKDTAELINSLHLVVSVDTAVLHLAGALGKSTYGLLYEEPDARWEYKWYPTIKMFKKEKDWESVFEDILINITI
jgi:hypothetical protein